MRRILMTLGLLFAAGAARALDVREVAFSSATTYAVTVSSLTDTTMDSTQLAGRWAIEVQNQDASINIFCGFATSEVSGTAGRRVGPGGSWVVQLADKMRQPDGTSALNIYCQAASGSPTAQVTQLR